MMETGKDPLAGMGWEAPKKGAERPPVKTTERPSYGHDYSRRDTGSYLAKSEDEELADTVQTILNLKAPASRRDLKRFEGSLEQQTDLLDKYNQLQIRQEKEAADLYEQEMAEARRENQEAIEANRQEREARIDRFLQDVPVKSAKTA
ncbi:MAG: hypothetical protein WC813_04880 [Patescibacteria group bacterium]|jgi:hypothetical protein